MADRLALIMQLGALEAEAALRGDDRAVASLQAAAALLLNDKAAVDEMTAARAEEERRREDARLRKRRSRDNRSQDVTDVTSGHANSRDGSLGFSPTPPFPNLQTQHNTPREAAERLYAESVENLVALITQRVGPLWPDVDGFLKRRQYVTWQAWLKEMLAVITGGIATVEDLAQVCRDDAALERPIATPKGLRVFVASSARERNTPDIHRAPVRGGVANRTFAAGRGALEGLP